MTNAPTRSPFARSTKGQLRCYHCRNTVPSKDGSWQSWESMQVFLCKGCNLSTQDRPERKSK